MCNRALTVGDNAGLQGDQLYHYATESSHGPLHSGVDIKVVLKIQLIDHNY